MVCTKYTHVTAAPPPLPPRWVLVKERNYLNAERMLYRAQGREMPAPMRLTLVRGCLPAV